MKKQDTRLFSVIILISIIITLTACSHSEDEVKAKIEKYLMEKYEEEFVVDRIGTRSANEETYFQARIYPKSIMGTQKEDDSYYYGSASVEIKSFGRLGGVGDDYSYILRNIDVEQYLSVFIKNKFGDRVLIDVDVQHKKTGDGSWWAGYKSKSLKEMRDDIKKDPEKNRIELEIYLYIFDRIDNEQEKEERRKQIYDFVQYLKEEGLFEYLELGVIFIDERVLAPSYEEKYRIKLIISDTEREIIDGKIVYLPPMKLRKEISEVLQEELARMSEEELLKSMNRIKKSQLSYEGIREYNGQYNCWIYSLKMIELYYNVTDEDKNRNYNNLQDIEFVRYKKYVYVN